MTARVANRNFVAATREEGKQSLKNVMVASRIVTEDKNWCIHVYLEEEFEWSIFQWRTGRWSKGRRMLPKKCILGRLFSLFPWTQSHSKRPSQITFWFVLLRSLVYISCRRHRMWSFWWHANTELLSESVLSNAWKVTTARQLKLSHELLESCFDAQAHFVACCFAIAACYWLCPLVPRCFCFCRQHGWWR